MESVRPTAVAGSFYPSGPEELRPMVEQMLDAAASRASPGIDAKAVIAPHAGYAYSGEVAGSAFRVFEPEADRIRKIVLLGPAHRIPIRGLALPSCASFASPLGEVTVDMDLVGAVADLPQVEVSPEAHALEHSLEVELPFLQVVLGEFTFLPLVVGEARAEEVAEVLERVWGGAETRIVISSDLSHYLTYDLASRTDRRTAEKIVRLEWPIEPESACGAGPINGLLLAAERRSLQASLLDLRNSGDTAGGRDHVVGYGAFAFSETR